MQAPRPWQKCVTRCIVLPALLASAAGALLLPWSLIAWIYHIPRIVHALPDWSLGLGLIAGGLAIALSCAALANPSGSLPVGNPHHDPRRPEHDHQPH